MTINDLLETLTCILISAVLLLTTTGNILNQASPIKLQLENPLAPLAINAILDTGFTLKLFRYYPPP